MNVYRVSCETYDRAWYVVAKRSDSATKLVVKMTEERGWDEEYPEEERKWECERVFTKLGEITESRDL